MDTAGAAISQSTRMIKHTVPAELGGTRLDLIVSELFSVTRSQAKKYIDAGRILVDDHPPKKSGDIVKESSTICLTKEIVTPMLEIVAESIDTSLIPIVIQETEHYLIIDKPAGLLSHPTQAQEPWSLAHWVWNTYPELKTVGEYSDRPGIVHRLDKDTSGLMVIAKTQDMFDHLKFQFKERMVDKRYTSLVHGVVHRDIDTIDFDIDRGNDGRMVARPKTDPLKLKNVGKSQPGKHAKTEFLVLERYSRYTLLDLKIYTGRTHQIRVHMFAYGYPVVGDPLYTNTTTNRALDKRLGRLFLHAHHLAFQDLAGEQIDATIELPPQLTDILATLK